MYYLDFTPEFNKAYAKLVKKDASIEKRVEKALRLLKENPSHPSLKSHKANTLHHGLRWRSIVTGDLRIIWDYDEEETLVIILLTLGGHSGRKKVYK